jgi:D-alanine-D-alanine ligase
MKVLVLCGGESVERVVSWASGDAVAAWLSEAGHETTKYDPETPGALRSVHERMAPDAIGIAAPLPVAHGEYDATTLRGLLDALDRVRPDVVFPILHGGRGEDGTLQAILDWVGIPYAGSPALACGLAMDKHHARLVFKVHGVPITDGFVVPFEHMADGEYVRRRISHNFGYPAVVKPQNGGSTVGLTKVYQPDDVAGALAAVSALGDQALIEAHFTGREIAATVVADEAYPLVEIQPKSGYYDYANKYTSGRTDYVCPAEISPEESARIQTAALTAFRALGCAGFSRVDFLLGPNGDFVCLELNTLPGMTQNSLVPKAARAKGEQPPELVQKILECALVSVQRAG